jgi:hypothetical protein
MLTSRSPQALPRSVGTLGLCEPSERAAPSRFRQPPNRHISGDAPLLTAISTVHLPNCLLFGESGPAVLSRCLCKPFLFSGSIHHWSGNQGGSNPALFQ